MIRNLLKFIHIYDKIFLTMKCKEVMKVKNQRPKPAKASKWIRIAIYIILAFLVVRSELIKVGVLPGASEQNYSAIEEYSDKPYVEMNGNKPEFDNLTTECFEKYAKLDELGRCGVAYACVGLEIMPTEERGAIGQVKPSGWHTIKYDIVDGKYLYNRCHLIGYQLTGENANTKNLITGTRYLNVEGMLPFENMVAEYVEETGNHVMYRVTPHFEGRNLVASGVQMEAYSVEDDGRGVCFNVYVYNAQPGITIDYKSGDSRLTENE